MGSGERRLEHSTAKPFGPSRADRGRVRRPGDDAYTPLAIDVLRIADGAITDIVTFDGSLSGWLGLPEKL